jgi:hypothetical protein
MDEFSKLLTPCMDAEHFDLWTQKYFGFVLPDCTVSRFSNSNPKDFAWTIVEAMRKGEPLSIAGLAGRDGSKTASLSVIALIAPLMFLRDVVHIGMTKRQASRAKNYLERAINKHEEIKALIAKQNTNETKFSIGGELVGLELIACTPKDVQGPRASVLSFDEVSSSMQPENVKAFADAHGIPSASKSGAPAIVIKITSRQARYSLIELELKERHKTGLVVKQWSTIDTMVRCPDSRSGTLPVKAWINTQKGEWYTEEEFKNTTPDQREGFDLDSVYDGCLKCPLLVYCRADSKRQTSASPLLRKVEDVITKLVNAKSHEWGLSQIMSLEPSKEGLIYWEYGDDIHVKDWSQMWQILTGETPKQPITKSQWIQKAHELGVDFYAGVDFGYSHPTTCVVIGVDKKENVYVVEGIGRVRMKDADFADLVKQILQPVYRIQMYCPDSEDPAGVQDFKDAGLPTVAIDKSAGSVKRGINVIKGFLKIVGKRGDTKIYFSKDLDDRDLGFPNILQEMTLYHKQVDKAGKIKDDEDPSKEFDDFLDALRYVMFWLFGKQLAQVTFADLPAHLQPPSNLREAMVDQASALTHTQIDQSPQDPAKDPKDPNVPSQGGGLQFRFT